MTRLLSTFHSPLRDSARINITVTRARDLISMIPSQSNKRQLLLTDPASLSLRTLLIKKEDWLEMTNAAAPIELSEEPRLSVCVLKEVMNAVYYIYDTQFWNFEERHEAGAGEEPGK